MRSFIPVEPSNHFPIQNLPYGIFRLRDNSGKPRVGTAIGEYVLDLSVLEEEGYFQDIIDQEEKVFAAPFLNPFMAKGPDVWQSVRRRLQMLLSENEPKLRDNVQLRERALIPQADVKMELP